PPVAAVERRPRPAAALGPHPRHGAGHGVDGPTDRRCRPVHTMIAEFGARGALMHPTHRNRRSCGPVRVVELRGIEPLTYSMRTSRATNCATAPVPRSGTHKP